MALLTEELTKGSWETNQWEDIMALLAEWDVDEYQDRPRAYHMSEAFVAKSKSDPDTPTYLEALTGDHAEGYYQAMEEEIKNLERRMTWKVVPRSSVGSHPVIPTTWAFKCKRLSDGLFRKLKA